MLLVRESLLDHGTRLEQEDVSVQCQEAGGDLDPESVSDVLGEPRVTGPT